MEKQELIIYCDYCQQDLRMSGLLCHDSKTETNFYGNYFIMVGNNKLVYFKEKTEISFEAYQN
jgi:hypothetical protein